MIIEVSNVFCSFKKAINQKMNKNRILIKENFKNFFVNFNEKAANTTPKKPRKRQSNLKVFPCIKKPFTDQIIKKKLKTKIFVLKTFLLLLAIKYLFINYFYLDALYSIKL